MTVVAELTIQALRQLGLESLPQYEKNLTRACSISPPPYGHRQYGETFRSLAADPDWLAQSLITNALAEGDGSNRLWDLAASTVSRSNASEVKRHSIDESRHARWYIAITELVFPGSIDPSLRTNIETLVPFYGDDDVPSANPNSPFAHDVDIDDLIQMNIAEIRTRFHHLMQRPVLMAYAPKASISKLERLLDTLLLDETRHIAYTAQLIEGMTTRYGIKATADLMLERIRDFNDVTEKELGSLSFRSCAGCRGCSMAR